MIVDLVPLDKVKLQLDWQPPARNGTQISRRPPGILISKLETTGTNWERVIPIVAGHGGGELQSSERPGRCGAWSTGGETVQTCRASEDGRETAARGQ
jgi:hypothetical protein